MKTDKIYLVGFMASGKTTIARALAARLGWRSEDVDDLIEKRERLTRGRDLRAARRAVLPRGRARHPQAGAADAQPRRGDWRRHVRRSREPRRDQLDGVSVWIDLPLADLIPRIPMDGRRPLASDRAQLERLYALARRSVPGRAAPRGRVAHVHVQNRGPHPRGHSPPALGRSPADAPRVSPCAT